MIWRIVALPLLEFLLGIVWLKNVQVGNYAMAVIIAMVALYTAIIDRVLARVLKEDGE